MYADSYCTCTIAGPDGVSCLTAYTEYIILSVTCTASLNLQVNVTGIYTEKTSLFFVDIELIFIYIMRTCAAVKETHILAFQQDIDNSSYMVFALIPSIHVYTI